MRILIKTDSFNTLLAKKNMTQRELASKMSVTTVHICNVVKANSPVSPDLRKKIMAIFPGTRWETLFRIEE